MALRALTLVVLLGLSPAAGAVEAVFHLCHGQMQFTPTCCCDHSQPRPEQPDAQVSGGQAQCCDELSAQLAPRTEATAGSGWNWAPLPVVGALPATPPAPAAWELPPSVGARGLGAHRATAPPLYLQNCSYLI